MEAPKTGDKVLLPDGRAAVVVEGVIDDTGRVCVETMFGMAWYSPEELRPAEHHPSEGRGVMSATEHGFQRGKERLGFSKSTTERLAEKALREGIRQADAKGRLRRYLDGMSMAHGTTPIVYGHHVFVFGHGERLVTVVHLPGSLRRAWSTHAKRACDAGGAR